MIMEPVIYSRIPSDHEIDSRFGEWIRKCRFEANLSIFESSKLTQIAMKRILEIEEGSGKGVTRKECDELALAYGLPLADVVSRAGGVHLRLVT